MHQSLSPRRLRSRSPLFLCQTHIMRFLCWGWKPWDPGASPLCAFCDVILPPVGSARDKGTVPTCGVAGVCPLLHGGTLAKALSVCTHSSGPPPLISSLTVAYHKTGKEMFPPHDYGHCQHPQGEECEKSGHILNERYLGRRSKPPQVVLSCLFRCPKAFPGPRTWATLCTS